MKKIALFTAAALLAVLTPVAVIASTEAPAKEAHGPIYCDPDAYPNCI